MVIQNGLLQITYLIIKLIQCISFDVLLFTKSGTLNKCTILGIVFESVERGQSINLDKQKKRNNSQIMKILINPYPLGEGGRSMRLPITSISLLILMGVGGQPLDNSVF